MRIAVVFDQLFYGGIERVGVNYVNMLISQGHKVDIYILNPSTITGIINDFPKECQIKKMFLSEYMCPERYWYIAKRWTLGIFLFPIIYIVLRLFLFIYKIPFLFRCSYDLAIAFAGHTPDLTFVAYNIVRSKKKAAWLHGGLYSYMIISPGFTRLYKKIKNLVCLNKLVENECFFYNKYLKSKIHTTKIYNPVYIAEQPLDTLKIEHLNKKYGDFIVMVARLTYPKNHKSVIEACSILRKKYKIEKTFVFVGEGPLKDELLSYAKELNVNDLCSFVGNKTDVQNYYFAAHLFVLSSFSEGLPTVLIEAACFGLPLISSDSSVREILGANEYGLVCPINDSEALAEAIYSLLSSDEKYKHYSEQAKIRFQEFEPDKINKQLIQFIKNLR